MQTTIIGSGIIGLSSAYYLLKAGHSVTIIDKSNDQEGCSYGNAGMICPSHIIPLASPGMIEKGIRWMFDSESPFYVKPRMNWELLNWGLKFYQSATKKHVEKAKPVFRDFSLFSKKLYQEISHELDFHYQEKGLLMLCRTEHGLEEELEAAKQANAVGIKAKALTINELHELESEIKPTVKGAVLYEGDAQCYPNELMAQLRSYLQKNGVKFLLTTEVIGFETEKNKVTALKLSTSQTLKITNLVIATGSWSPLLAKHLHLRLPMQAGKGYSLTQPQKQSKKLQTPTILLEDRVAITPFTENTIRFGGTMEIGGINDTINMNRVRGIIKAIPAYFPDYQLNMPQKSEVWCGLRPCSPDGLPYIGKVEKYQNLTVATGHAMLGLSLAPATGKLVQELVNNQKTTLNISMCKVERF